MPNSNLARRAIVLKSTKDSNDVRVQQVGFNENAIDAEVWAPYGMSYNVPVGSQGLLIQVGGDAGNNIFLPDRSQDRIKGLKENEVAFFNPISKSRAIFLDNGDIVIITEGTNGDMIVTIKGDNTVNIGGECNITIDGDCNLKAASVNIDASVTNLGVGGSPIARLGDSVSVTVIGVTPGGATIPASGTITSGSSSNKSI